MGIRFRCGECRDKINVKDFLAGKRGVCPKCGAKVQIPLQSDPEFGNAPHEPEADLRLQPSSAPVITGAPSTQMPAGAAPMVIPTAEAVMTPVQPTVAQPYAAQPFTAQPVVAQPATTPYGASTYPVASSPAQPLPAGYSSQPVTGYPIMQPAAPYIASPASPLPRDPFLERPQAQWYVRHAAGQQYGPAPAVTFQKWLAEGRIPADGLVWRDDWADWQSAASVFPQLQAPPAPVMAGGPLLPPAAQPTSSRAADPFEFGSSSGNGGGSSAVSQAILRRRDNSQTILIVSIVLLLLIGIGVAILIVVLNNRGNQETEEETVSRLSPTCVLLETDHR